MSHNVITEEMRQEVRLALKEHINKMNHKGDFIYTKECDCGALSYTEEYPEDLPKSDHPIFWHKYNCKLKSNRAI